jgi:hypothetical protein
LSPKLFRRGSAVPADVVARAALPRGEGVLAAAEARDGTWLLGTRTALVIVPAGSPAGEPVEILPWERVQAADWSRDDDRLRVTEVGEYGEPQPRHLFQLDEPTRLLQLLRERVSASVVLQRRVTVSGRRGLFVIARRSPTGHGEIRWAYEFDRGVDPDDPEVRSLAESGLRAAADELGLG